MKVVHYLPVKNLRSFVSHLVHNPVLVSAVVIVAILALACRSTCSGRGPGRANPCSS